MDAALNWPRKTRELAVNKGTNGRWREVLTPEESEKYERLALKNLGEDYAHWLATGEHGSHVPVTASVARQSS